MYALVTFVGTDIGGTGATLGSRDTKTTIFPANPSAYTDVVGDGKFIKLDRDAPGDDLFESGDVTRVDKNGVVKTGAAFINRFIRTEAKLKAVFRDHSIKLQIVHVAPEVNDPDTDVDETMIYDNFEDALVGYDGEVTATDLFSSTDPRTVIDSVKVTAGKFKLQYAMAVASADAAKGDEVERDGMTVRVKVSVEDQAGNSTEQMFGTNAMMNP